MANHVNIITYLEDDSDERPLELVRLNESDTAIITFTADSVSTQLHYCGEPEINSYVLCNGANCLLCRIGRKKEERLLIPVYVPTKEAVAVLAVSTNKRPGALLPQIGPLLRDGPRLAFLSRHGGIFKVKGAAIPDDADRGEVAVKRFVEAHSAGTIDLTKVFLTIENEYLAQVREIASMVKLKGLSA
jgi:hypothetical protein